MPARIFRAEQIGSLLRPKSLLDLRRRHAAGEVSDDELRQAEDAAIRDAIAMQERVGLGMVCDGEFRRASYHSYFFSKLGKLKPDWRAPSDQPGVAQTRAPQPQALIDSRVAWTAPIHVDDFNFLAENSKLTPKVTIPGPCALHFRGGDQAVLKSAYTDVEQFWDDTVSAFCKELEALAAAGCTYVQMDETSFAKFGDPNVQETLAARGEKWRETIELYVKIINRVLEGCPPQIRMGIHLCRGNRAGQFHAEGSYEEVAEKMFNALKLDTFLLEYDSDRAGGFEPLRHLPAGKLAVLGLVSTKTPQMEDPQLLRSRIEEATKFTGLDNLAISPQCGFASVDIGNPLTPEDQEAKLKLVVDVARGVWGSN